MSCVLCPPRETECQFCAPVIHKMYEEKFGVLHRNHYQLKTVNSGLHPSGNGPARLRSGVPKCKKCKFWHNHPSIPMSYGFCHKAIDDEHKKIAGNYDCCDKFVRDQSR